ncbi:hypothetical protein CHISP_2303 [Chitinispirillum alkaliphilum]|nr:hypothetical protein CHISP_2303 [Chitinispirillum alkaliphilum]
MKQYSTQIVASVLALILAFALTARIRYQRNFFDQMVTDALETSEGYDQRFIDLVQKLEYELTLRASFGYTGQKDPMTGRERVVLVQTPPVRRQPVRREVKQEEVDPIRLTAIIYEEERGVHTAIVMDRDRSYSVEMKDQVAGRTISRITASKIFMEDDKAIYYYDIDGSKGKELK